MVECNGTTGSVATHIPPRRAGGSVRIIPGIEPNHERHTLPRNAGLCIDHAMPPPHLNLIVLRSPDIHRAVAFYQTLGLVFTLHAHGSGPEHFSSEFNGLVFEIYPFGPKSAPTKGTRIGFRVDSVDPLLLLLIALGAELITPPADTEWGRRAVIKDLDGHIVELITSVG